MTEITREDNEVLDAIVAKSICCPEIELPDEVDSDFVMDLAAFARTHVRDSAASAIEGALLQVEMIKKWPEDWMVVVFNEIGWYEYTPWADEWEEE